MSKRKSSTQPDTRPAAEPAAPAEEGPTITQFGAAQPQAKDAQADAGGPPTITSFGAPQPRPVEPVEDKAVTYQTKIITPSSKAAPLPSEEPTSAASDSQPADSEGDDKDA